MSCMWKEFKMSKVKFITFSDVHISDINPTARLGDYKKDILNKLKQIGAAGKKLGVNFYVFGGDLYHIKAPIRNTHNLNTLLMETFKDYGAPIYATEGNHDLRGSYENFDEQPLKVLYTSGTLEQIREKELNINGINLLLRSNGFSEEPIINIPTIDHDVKVYDVSICSLHIFSTPKGGNLFKTKLFSYDEISKCGDDVFVLGHYHIDQGIQTLNNNGFNQYFINLGSVGRGTTSEDNITRDPKIGYVEIEKDDTGKISIKAQAIKLKVKPASEIFDLAEKKSEQEKQEATAAFVEQLQNGMEETVTGTGTVENELEKLNLEKEITDTVNHYLTEADLAIKDLVK